MIEASAGPGRIQYCRSADRYLTEGDGKRTFHSFSYGTHYDPDNVGFGPIRAINVEHLAPGAGYDPHRHSDVEILTWVLDGALRHEDSSGAGGVIRPGTAQRLSAGRGAEHSEVNDSDDEPLVFVQMMLASDRDGTPEYAVAEVPDRSGVLLPTVDLHAPATLWVLRLEPQQTVLVPAAPRSLVHVTRGRVLLRDTLLDEGDEARLVAAGPYDLGATGVGGEVLVWQLES